MNFPHPARYVTQAEIRRIRSCQCMICWRQPPSYVYNARGHGYQGWIGYLWPLCEKHRWEVQQRGWKELLNYYGINSRNDPKDLRPLEW
ncbi:MAG: hypothetical protein FH756_01590 [Firmicutes bacterium]|nr:hypothetical protein [Bacillota bacterium]